MPLEKAPHWTDLYYRIVEHYFWRPQAIGRISDPQKTSHPWNSWRAKLQSQETPLNHILDLLFYICPEKLLDRVISALVGRPLSNLQLVVPSDGTIDGNIVQPDIIVRNSTALVFVEMKVDSQSSIDQFAKYAIAAHCITRDEPAIQSVDLVVLTRHVEHKQIWKNARKLNLSDDRAVRDTAIRALNVDPSIWGERGVQRFVRNNPKSIASLTQRMDTMGLHLQDYSALEKALCEYAAEEITVRRLIEGVLQEFVRRELTGNAQQCAPSDVPAASRQERG